MTSSKKNLQQELAKLGDNFTRNLPVRLTKLAALVSSLRNKWDADTAKELYRESHSLAGSGGTFGLQEISATARTMQNTVQTLMQLDPAPDAQQLSVLDQLITELATAISSPGIITSRDTDDKAQVEASEAIGYPEQLPGMSNQPIKILVADDEPYALEHLKLLLEKDGHEVIAAENGEQAIRLFRQHSPELVLLDVIMPVMDGLEAARHIKQDCANHFVPVLFLTSLESDDDLVKCIEAGGDDFLSKPLNFVVLRARIHALQRIRELNNELELYHQRTEEEIKLSKHVFESITQRNSGNHDAIQHWASASGHFSGDLVCYQESLNGSQYLLLGDFTGHGLIAALGAIPVTDVFYTMSLQGFTLDDIASEINRKLKLLLPTGRFFAAGLFRINQNTQQVDYWFGGLPPAMLIDINNRVTLLKADKLALGILGAEQFDATIGSFSLDDYTHMLMYSDGLTEIANENGEMLGEDAVIQAIEAGSGENLIDTVINCMQAHSDVSTAEDDITLVSTDFRQFRQ